MLGFYPESANPISISGTTVIVLIADIHSNASASADLSTRINLASNISCSTNTNSALNTKIKLNSNILTCNSTNNATLANFYPQYNHLSLMVIYNINQFIIKAE